MKNVEKLANDHWDYIQKLLSFTIIQPNTFKSYQEFLYKSAFIHGYKHGVSDKNEN